MTETTPTHVPRQNKVLAYLTRQRGGNVDGKTELLAFINLDPDGPTGFEVPGGGVDDGETPEEAVLRELHEEAGIDDARIDRLLHVYGWWNSYRRFVQTRHVFLLSVDRDLPDAWEHTVFGGGGDNGKRFAYRWLPLRHAGALSWDMGTSARLLVHPPKRVAVKRPDLPEDLKIRPAAAGDLGAITAIQNHYIRTSTAIYTDKLAEEMDLWQRLKNFDAKRHPLIVASDHGEVLGYAGLSPTDSKTGYRHTVENSVYIHPDHVGQGIGAALLEELLKLADTAGHHVILARIDSGQPASIALHRRFGFELAGVLPEVGWKFDAWRDAQLWLRRADPKSQ